MFSLLSILGKQILNSTYLHTCLTTHMLGLNQDCVDHSPLIRQTSLRRDEVEVPKVATLLGSRDQCFSVDKTLSSLACLLYLLYGWNYIIVLWMPLLYCCDRYIYVGMYLLLLQIKRNFYFINKIYNQYKPNAYYFTKHLFWHLY